MEETRVSDRAIERLRAEKARFDGERTAWGDRLLREALARREAGRKAALRWMEGGALFTEIESIAARGDTAYPFFEGISGSSDPDFNNGFHSAAKEVWELIEGPAERRPS
jgi:hypothetical protein